jgi:hypothetical protein
MLEATIIKLVPSYFMPVFSQLVNKKGGNATVMERVSGIVIRYFEV